MATQSIARPALRVQRDYSPISWTEYFDEALDIRISASNSDANDSFRTYLKNFHLEPYAPTREVGKRLSSRHVDLSHDQVKQLCQIPTLVMLHGGGYSGLTWSHFVKDIGQHCKCRLIAMDLRSHGDTHTSDDSKMDIDTLVSDVSRVIIETHHFCGFPELPAIVLIGHSMGGAVAVRCSTDERLRSSGLVVIDVVEGTAREALPLMMSVIKTRPSRFPSLENAIEWSVRSGMAKNQEAARVSMPGNLVNIMTGNLAIHDVESHISELADLNKTLMKNKINVTIYQLVGQPLPQPLMPRSPLPPRIRSLRGGGPSFSEPIDTSDNVIKEDAEDSNGHVHSAVARLRNQDDDGYKRPPDVETKGYTWRTNLAKTQPHWDGWFRGLSEKLLSSPAQSKFLLLAGIDRLDKTLTIGQMQGKFMMKVLPKCGHAVHEDVPEQVARTIGEFLVRNKLAKPMN